MSVTLSLPCCGKEIHPTMRKSKLKERPRLHACEKCGKAFAIFANGAIEDITHMSTTPADAIKNFKLACNC